ncbi:MAG: flagellar basal body rod protein FlgB [Exilibacterium sp.]
MSISFEKALGIHATALKLRAQRAALLADNLANVDTPNFKARDINFQDLLKRQTAHQAPAFAMVSTHKKHRVEAAAATRDEVLYRIPQQPSIDGNTVEEQVEHAEFTKNVLAYQASFRFLDGRFKGLKTAIKGE